MKITKITNTSLAAQGAPAHHLQCRPRRIHDNANFDAHAICCHWILYGWKGLKWDTFLAYWALQTTYAKHSLIWQSNPWLQPREMKTILQKDTFHSKNARGNK